MKKKILIVCLCLTTILSVSGCSNKDDDGLTNSNIPNSNTISEVATDLKQPLFRYVTDLQAVADVIYSISASSETKPVSYIGLTNYNYLIVPYYKDLEVQTNPASAQAKIIGLSESKNAGYQLTSKIGTQTVWVTMWSVESDNYTESKENPYKYLYGKLNASNKSAVDNGFEQVSIDIGDEKVTAIRQPYGKVENLPNDEIIAFAYDGYMVNIQLRKSGTETDITTLALSEFLTFQRINIEEKIVVSSVEETSSEEQTESSEESVEESSSVQP